MTSLNDDALFADDTLAVYLSELHRIPPLSRDEEMDCIDHVRAGDQMAESAGKRLAEANLLLVVSIAERYRNDHIFLLCLAVTLGTMWLWKRFTGQ